MTAPRSIRGPMFELHADGDRMTRPADTEPRDSGLRRFPDGNPRNERYSLARYKRAVRAGCSTELLFEAAADDLTVHELGVLSLYLQRLGHKVPHPPTRRGDAWQLVKAPWKPPAGFDRTLFALKLIAAGWKREHALEAAMLSRSTLQRELARSARRSTRNGPRKPAPQAGSHVSNGGGQWGRATPGERTHEDPGNDSVTRTGPDLAQLELFEGVTA